MNYKATRRILYNVLREVKGRDLQKKHLLDFIVSKTSSDLSQQTKQQVAEFCYQVYKKVEKCNRNHHRFLKENKKWLDVEIIFNLHPQPVGGRPKLNFADSSFRSKRRKTEHLRTIEGGDSLIYAGSMKLREEGSLDKVHLLQEMEKTPTRAKKIRQCWELAQKSNNAEAYNVDNALALFLEADLTPHQYQLLRNGAINFQHDIYPSYNHLLEAKKRCYPDNVHVTELVAEVSLQSLLDHTVRRLLLVQEEVICRIPKEYRASLILLLKWGCDGSTGHSKYKQIAQEEGFQDTDIFFTSLVPLRLFYNSPNMGKFVIWQNLCPSSTRFCRPIKLQFKKETVELTEKEVKCIQDQAASLSPKITEIDSDTFEVRHTLQLTMIDGKVCNSLTSTKSAQKCYVCGATSKEMNSFNVKIKSENPETFQFGLSTLHAWIRFMEWLLHVSYRLEIKECQARGEVKKNVINKRKKIIQEKLKTELGLLVDEPRQSGSGTSNDGNTARRFFENAKKVSEITGIDESLIHKCATLLQAPSCTLDIDPDKFEKWTKKTHELYVSLYPWYYIPASVHKILIHGPSIISSALLPIGQMSEEAQEARNKHIKQYREHHARTSSRENTMKDVLLRLFATSDPLISTLRQTMAQSNKKKLLSKCVLDLMKAPVEPAAELDIDSE